MIMTAWLRSKMGNMEKETKRVAWLDTWDLKDQYPKLNFHFFLLFSLSSSFLQQTFIELLLCARQCTGCEVFSTALTLMFPVLATGHFIFPVQAKKLSCL